MSLHIRQICLLSSDLVRVVDELTHVFGLQVCHRDPVVAKYGLENVLLPIGSDFLEIVAPIKDDTAAGRYMSRRGGDCGYMVIAQAQSRNQQAEIRARALKLGVRVAHEEEREGWSFCQLHPADMEAAFLDIEWDAEENYQGCWHPAGGKHWPKFVRQDRCKKMIGVELQCKNPQQLYSKWAEIISDEASRSEDTVLPLKNMELVFVAAPAGSGAGLSAIHLHVSDRAKVLSAAAERGLEVVDNQLLLCGTRFVLHEVA